MKPNIIFYTQAYNAEQYIEKTITSILEQSHPHFLYYIVDDGSTDNTRQIIDAYAKQDARIIPIYYDTNDYLINYNKTLEQIYTHTDIAYFAFLDADDYYDKDFARNGIYLLENTKTQLYICGSYFETPNHTHIGNRQYEGALVKISQSDIPKYFPYLFPHFRTCWGKIYSLPLLIKHHITIPLSLPLGFDTGFFFNYFEYVDSFLLDPNLLHHYIVDPESTSYRYRPNRIDCNMELHKIIKKYLFSKNANTEQNLLYLDVISLNHFIDTLIISLRAVNDEIIPENEVLNLLKSDFLHHLIQSINNYTHIDLFTENEIFEHSRKELSKIMTMNSYTKQPHIYEALFKTFFQFVNQFWTLEDIPFFLSNNNQTKLFYLNGQFQEAYDNFDLNLLNTPEEDLFYLELHLRTTPDTAHTFLIHCLDKKISFTSKQIDYILSTSTIFNNVIHGDILFNYHQLLLLFLHKEYEGFLSILQNELTQIAQINPSDGYALTEIALEFSLSLNNADYYVFFSKAQLEILLLQKNKTVFYEKYNELNQYLTNDPNLVFFKQYADNLFNN